MDPLEAAYLIQKECNAARAKFPVFNSAHEGISVIREEFEELWEEIRKNPRAWNMVKCEAIQLGAMVHRFLIDLEEMQK